jgi:hypothetical protein
VRSLVQFAVLGWSRAPCSVFCFQRVVVLCSFLSLSLGRLRLASSLLMLPPLGKRLRFVYQSSFGVLKNGGTS